jgi:hypothetical protein
MKDSQEITTSAITFALWKSDTVQPQIQIGLL